MRPFTMLTATPIRITRPSHFSYLFVLARIAVAPH
jgi:hypothetical protein